MFKSISLIFAGVNLVFFLGSLIRRSSWRNHNIITPMANLGATLLGISVALRGPFQYAAICAGSLIILAGVFIGKRRSKRAGLG